MAKDIQLGDGITIVVNSAEVLSALNGQMSRALEAVGMQAEGYAKAGCPVDTDRLRGSISHEVHGNTVYIGTDVEYAECVELNEKAKHPNGGQAHYLKNSVAGHTGEYQRIISSIINQG